jgi:bacterioferritin-associated ferredoxin
MLVCHCNIISEREIEETIRGMLADDPWQLIVPGKVYHAMEKQGRCCGCFPNVVDIIIRVTEDYHRNAGADPGRLNVLQAQFDTMRRKHERIGGRRDERRTAGNRAA